MSMVPAPGLFHSRCFCLPNQQRPEGHMKNVAFLDKAAHEKNTSLTFALRQSDVLEFYISYVTFYQYVSNTTRKESSMKKILSTIVATLVAVSFATVAFAADVPTTEPATDAPAAEMKQDEAKPMKKHHKHHRHHRHHRHHKHHKHDKDTQKEAPAAAPD